MAHVLKIIVFPFFDTNERIVMPFCTLRLVATVLKFMDKSHSPLYCYYY